MIHNPKLLLLLATCCVSLVLLGCGRKGDLFIPESPIPEPLVPTSTNPNQTLQEK